MQCAGFVKGERGYGPGLEAEASAFRGDGVAEVAVVDDDAFVEGLLHPAAAEDDHGFPGEGLAFERGALEPAHGGNEVFLAGDVEAAFLPQADGEDGRVVGVEQALQGDVAAHGDVGADLHAGGYYGPGFAVHHILGQPEVGHGMARHPAHDRRALVNGDGVPEQGGEAGGGVPEAGRGMKRVSCPVSAANRSSAWMATGSSYSARLHLVSHGCGHTRPVMPGKGLRACSRARALPVSPAAISVCICWMPLPRGQACSQGDVRP